MSIPHLPAVVKVEKDNCIACQSCIRACPVNICNRFEGDTVEINNDLCIGCGQCIDACTHGARIRLDDFERFQKDAEAGGRFVAVAAPAVAAQFPDTFLHFNGWLKKDFNVDSLFDVSFGAELTIRSYLEHVKSNPACVIAQPCPALVSYIEIYHPELLPYLAPADSPMLHTAKMVREFYPQYKDHKIIIVSPCIAKSREFQETGVADYNVTMHSLQSYLEKSNIDLKQYEQIDYENPPAERGVLFSTPGGLLRTAKRWDRNIENITRKIEGPGLVYHYFSSLKSSIDKGIAPKIIDCLNCEAGCNGGTAVPNRKLPLDELEAFIEKRNKKACENYAGKYKNDDNVIAKELESIIDEYWKPDLYSRTYTDRSSTNTTRTPDEAELQEIFSRLNKKDEADIYNCGACGYDTCKDMATAIFNGLNVPDSCLHFAMDKYRESEGERMKLSEERIRREQAARDQFLKMHMIFFLSQERYGIGLTYVTEVVQMMKTTALPDVPEHIKGVVNLRGRIIPVIDLRLFLGIESHEYNERTSIIITRNGDNYLGLIVDSIDEVNTFEEDNISEFSIQYKDTLFEDEYIKGIARLEEKVVILLNGSELIRHNTSCTPESAEITV